MFIFIFIFILGYFIGSISFAQIFAQKNGINILKTGSKNAGATNVRRIIGKSSGNIVFILDALKGFLAALFPVLLISSEKYNIVYLSCFSLFSSIIGHSFSFFIKFKGGKGVSTTIGGLMFINPLLSILGITIWLIVFYSTRYVSLASIVFALTLPFNFYFFIQNNDLCLFYFLSVFSIIICSRHYTNVIRLIKMKEKKFK